MCREVDFPLLGGCSACCQECLASWTYILLACTLINRGSVALLSHVLPLLRMSEPIRHIGTLFFRLWIASERKGYGCLLRYQAGSPSCPSQLAEAELCRPDTKRTRTGHSELIAASGGFGHCRAQALHTISDLSFCRT